MDIGECGVCGEWRSGTRFASGNRRPDGTTPCDNFVCFRCQQEARDERKSDQVSRPARRRLTSAAKLPYSELVNAA